MIQVDKKNLSISELKEICKKENNSWYALHIIRRISIFFTKLFLKTKITANQTSGISIFTGIVSCVFFAIGGNWNSFIGAIFLQLWYIFDCVDGDIARFRGSTSIEGKYIDSLNHYIITPLLFLCISIGLYNMFNHFYIVILGAFTALLICWGDNASDLVYSVLTVETAIPKNTIVNEQVSKIRENIGKSHRSIRLIYNCIKAPFVFSSFIFAILIVTLLDVFFMIYFPEFVSGEMAIEFGHIMAINIPSYSINFNFLYFYFMLSVLISLKNIINIFDYFNQMKYYSK